MNDDAQGYRTFGEETYSRQRTTYYNSSHGRFTSVDPLMASASIRDPQTFNRYSYVLNSPYKFTDPLGLLPMPYAKSSGSELVDKAMAGMASKREMNLLQWHVANGTALGYSYQNAVVRSQSQQNDDWYLKKPYFSRENNPALQQTDATLASTFTDSGTVLGASSVMLGESDFNHFKFEGGEVHTIHIYGNESATSNAGVYIPKEFSEVKISSKDTVIATNPKTKEVLLIAHVQVGTSMKTVRENMKTVRENGTVYIGQIGGEGGEGISSQGNRGRHSHLVLFPSENSRILATNFKKDLQKTLDQTADYTPAISKHLGDFRKFAK